MRGLMWTPLVRAPWRLAVHRNHPLAGRSRVTPQEVVREPLLVYCQRNYPEYWEAITAWLREHRQPPRIAGEYDGAENLMAAVESGLGVAFVSTQMARLFPNRAQLVTLSSSPEPVRIAAGQRADRADDKPLGVFVAELRKAAQAPA
jgi:DNA-binding transcriptional LysR family regulator